MVMKKGIVMGSTFRDFGILAGGLVCGASFMVIALYIAGLIN